MASEESRVGESPVHKILIVGGGAGGLELAVALGRTLDRRRASVTLVDANLSHVWKPLLHEVAAGVLDATHDEVSYAAQARWHGFRFVRGCMEGLDRRRRHITLAPWVGRFSGVETPPVELAYDTLVLAVGSVGNDFGIAGISEHCVFLDSTAQAEALRANLLERHVSNVAQGTASPLRVVIVGGGATGIELAAELVDANRRMARYRSPLAEGIEELDVTLIEAGPRLLPALPEKVAVNVKRTLNEMGIDVRVGTQVALADADGLVTADGTRIPGDIRIWAAGVKAPPFLAGLDGMQTNRVNQILVKSTLQSVSDNSVFAFGDCAACPVAPGAERNVAALAQAAHQQAQVLARNIRARIDGRPLADFRFRDKGTLVSLATKTTYGKVFGNRLVSGPTARLLYVSLYRLHQISVFGLWRTGWFVLGSMFSRRSKPSLKLH